MTSSHTSWTSPADDPEHPITSKAEAMRYILKLGQRVTSVGHTGTGKTTLLTRFLDELIPPRVPIVVVDPKNAFEAPRGGEGWEYTNDLPRLWERVTRREKRPELLRLVVRPFEHIYPLQKRNFEVLNDLYIRVYNAGRTILYLDDLQALTDEHRASAEMYRLWEMGRIKGVSVWQSTLRPARVPRPALAESDHWFTFYLVDPDDRDRVAGFTGIDKHAPAGPGAHDFWYRAPGPNVAPILVHQGEERERRDA